MTGWKTIKLGNIFWFKNGLNKGAEYFGSGTPIVNYMDVSKKGCMKKGSIQGLVNVSATEALNYSAKKGDIFFTRTSETLDGIGLSSVLMDTIHNCVFSGYLLRARPKAQELVPKYCAYSLRTPAIRKAIMRTSSMTTRALTNGRYLSEIKYSYPNKNKQQRIIAILETWDQYLENLDKKIEIKKNIKKGLAQRIFSRKIRFKNENGNDYPDWENVSLQETGKIVTGHTPNTKDPDLWSGDIPFITPTDISEDNKYQHSTQRTISQNNKSIPKGSILYTCIASIGKIAITTKRSATNQQINTVIVESERYNNEFIYYALQYLTPRLQSIFAATTVPIINKTEFSKLTIKTPKDIEEQKKIQEILSLLDEQISQLEDKRDTIDKQHKYLLNNLVTGKIRAPSGSTAYGKAGNNA